MVYRYNDEVKQNLISLLDAAAHFMYSSDQNAEDFLTGDVLKCMHIACLFHFAFDDPKLDEKPEWNFDIPDYEGHGLDAFVEETEKSGPTWMYLDAMAPSKVP